MYSMAFVLSISICFLALVPIFKSFKSYLSFSYTRFFAQFCDNVFGNQSHNDDHWRTERGPLPLSVPLPFFSNGKFL